MRTGCRLVHRRFCMLGMPLHIPVQARTKEFLCKFLESKTRTHYGPVGSGRRTAGRRGAAELGRTGRRRVDPARRQPSLLFSGESETLSWTPLRKHEKKLYQTKTDGGTKSAVDPRYKRFISGTASALRSWLLASVQTPICPRKHFSCKTCSGTGGGIKPAVDPRLTTGSSAVYHRFISGTKSALRSWLLTSIPTPICLYKFFSCKACPGKQTEKRNDRLTRG